MSDKIDWKNAQFTAADLKEHFGLEAGGGTFGSSNAQLGKNYLSADDVDRLKSDPKIKEAYFALRGEDHARAEHWDQDGNEGFELGEGSLDALLDDLTADKDDTASPTEALKDLPIEHSKTVQDAMARTEKWMEGETSGRHADEIYGASNDLAKGITKGEVGSTNASNKAAGYFNADKFNLDLGGKISDRVKAKMNAKSYKAGVATPQNTDQDNQEGF